MYTGILPTITVMDGCTLASCPLLQPSVDVHWHPAHYYSHRWMYTGILPTITAIGGCTLAAPTDSCQFLGAPSVNQTFRLPQSSAAQHARPSSPLLNNPVTRERNSKLDRNDHDLLRLHKDMVNAFFSSFSAHAHV